MRHLPEYDTNLYTSFDDQVADFERPHEVQEGVITNMELERPLVNLTDASNNNEAALFI